jgi:hypothetical protein
MPARPVLFVGLGTSGMRIVNEVEKLIYATFNENHFNHCRYVYIETNKAERPDPIPVESAIVGATIETDKMDSAIRSLAENPAIDTDWFSRDLAKQMNYNGMGAGGIRPAGRILLWSRNNFHDVHATLSTQWAAINAIRTGTGGRDDDSGNPVIYVVGSLAGGTCSGTFIDIGYMLRQITEGGDIGTNNARKVSLFGIFLTPREGTQGEMMCANTYGALSELQQFRQGRGYTEQWPNGIFAPITSQGPFDNIHLVSPEYGDGSGVMPKLSSCYFVVGMKLFCDVVGMNSEVGRVITDGGSTGAYTLFNTFGIAAVMHPTYSLSDAAGTQVASDLCARWIHEGLLYDSSGQTKAILDETVYNEATEFIEAQLIQEFAAIESRGGQLPLENEIENEIERVVNREARVADFTRRFLSGDPNNYLGVIQNHAPSCRDRLLLKIAARVSDTLNANQNLYYAELLLAKIQKVITDTVDYWGRTGLPSSQAWDTSVTTAVGEMFVHPHLLLLQRANTLRDRAQELIKLMKMKLMTVILKEVSEAIAGGKERPVFLVEGKRQPTIFRLRQLREALGELHREFQDRQEKIKAEATDESVPIVRVWTTDSYDGDLKALVGEHRRQKKLPSLSDVTDDVTDKDAWTVFDKQIETTSNTGANVTPGESNYSTGDLFKTFKSPYQRACQNLLRDTAVDPVAYARQNMGPTKDCANRALAGLLRLRAAPNVGAPGIPRFVLGPSKEAVAKLLGELNGKGYNHFRPEHAISVPFKNALIFYEEKSNIEPLTGLSVINRLRSCFENRPQSSSENLTPAIWREHRLAYGVTPENIARRDSRERVRKMMEFVIAFGLKYSQAYNQVYLPAGARWEDILPLDATEPPMWRCKIEGGPAQPFELSIDSLPKIRAIADNPIVYARFADALRKVLSANDDEAFIKIFETELHPRLALKGSEEIQRVSERLFGKIDKNGKRSDGVIGQLRQFLNQDEAGRIAAASPGPDLKIAGAASS